MKVGDSWVWPDTIRILVSIYLLAFVVGMLTKGFRESFFEWLSMNDTLGLRFWSKNWWFTIVTILVGVAAGMLILRGTT